MFEGSSFRVLLGPSWASLGARLGPLAIIIGVCVCHACVTMRCAIDMHKCVALNVCCYVCAFQCSQLITFYIKKE